MEDINGWIRVDGASGGFRGFERGCGEMVVV